MMFTRVLIFLIFIFCGLSRTINLSAQITPTHQVTLKALKHIYKHQFDSSKIITATIKDDLILKSLLEAFEMRWQYIPIFKSKEGERYIKILHSTIENIKSLKEKKDEVLYWHVTAELLLAEYYYSHGDAGQALLHGKRAYPLMMDAFDVSRKQPELTFVQGMYLYYMDFFRNKSFFYKAALFPLRDGDVEKGLKLLEQSADSYSMAQTEARIYLAHIYLHLENNPTKALGYAIKLVEDFPENHKMRELLIDNLLTLKRYAELQPLLQKQLSLNDAYYKIPALYFKACLERDVEKRTDKAKLSFESCVSFCTKADLYPDYKEKAEDAIKALTK